jgi:hypothetical protein
MHINFERRKRRRRMRRKRKSLTQSQNLTRQGSFQILSNAHRYVN